MASLRGSSSQDRSHHRGDLVKRVLLFTLLVLASACAGAQTGVLEEGDTPNDSASPGAASAAPDPTAFLPRAPAATASPTADGRAMVVARQQPRLSEISTSPDGAWRTEIVAYDCVAVSAEETLAYQELRLVDTKSASSRLADSQLQTCGGLGAAGLAGRFWSENSRYFYYTDAASGVPDGCGFWEPPYLRLDTADFGIEYLGGGPISPDGSLLAAWQGNRLSIWRIDGELVGVVEIPGSATVPGPIGWRPDSSAIAFLVSGGSCPLGETGLGRLDLSDMRPIIILAPHDPSFAGLLWDAPNRVTLTDEEGGLWRYNLLSRDLWQVAP